MTAAQDLQKTIEWIERLETQVESLRANLMSYICMQTQEPNPQWTGERLIALEAEVKALKETPIRLDERFKWLENKVGTLFVKVESMRELMDGLAATVCSIKVWEKGLEKC